ncbi:MAG TPA: alpha/beta hydrolase [Actinospica sp.]|jgi:pimeloyl-ACP methyl ester carboxylesterase|nr:alpha/beta hydrolase [Actinospica sp.]
MELATVDRTATVDGQTRHYRETGPAGASPIIALHGHPGTAETWDETARGLCAALGCRVLAVTARGYGASDRAASYAFADFAADVIGFADAVGLDRVVLLGHSMGGTVATLAAALQPERITALVLEDSVPPRDESEWPTPTRPDGELPYDWEITLAVVRQLARPDPKWWASLPLISAPTLVIGGGSTSHVPQQLLADAVETIPDARLVTLAGTGHSPHRTHTELFVATVVDFLREMPLVLPEHGH